MFEILKLAEFERIEQCCPEVPNKFCSTDVWKGHMDALFHHIEKEYQPELTLKERVLQETFPDDPIMGQIHYGKFGDYVYINYENEYRWYPAFPKSHNDAPSMGERADALQLYRRIHDFVNKLDSAPALENTESLASYALRYGPALAGLSSLTVKAGAGHHINFDKELKISVTLFMGPKLEEIQFSAANEIDNFATIDAAKKYLQRVTEQKTGVVD